MLFKNSVKSEVEFSIEITPAKKESIDSIKEIENECGLSPWSIEDYILELSRKDSIFLIASDKNIIAGFLLARLIMSGDGKLKKIPKNTCAKTNIEAEIYNIAVKTEFQRKGIGQSILTCFLRQIKSLGALKVWLEVRESNYSAIDFYRKNGFEKIYTRKNFYSAPFENAIIMKLDLSV